MNRLKMPIVAAVLALAGASAQADTYRVTAKTAGDKTYMHVELRLHGKGASSWFRLKGKHDSHGAVDGPYDYAVTGIGEVVTKIELDLERTHTFQATDGWTPEYVRIEHLASGTVSLFTQFSQVGSSPRTFGGSPKVTTASGNLETLRKGPGNPNVYQPALTVTNTGQVVRREVPVTYAQFAYNQSSISQDVMKYTEKWEDVEEVLVSTSKSTTKGLAIEAGWKSPKTAAGEFDLRTTASWETTMSSARSTSSSRLQGSAYDWSYKAPPYAGIFRKVVFRVPFAHTKYAVTKTGEVRWVRVVEKAFKPSGSPLMVQVPQHDDKGGVVPVSWDMIKKEFWPHLNQDSKNLAENRLAEWLQKGYVYTGKTPPKPVAAAEKKPEPQVQPPTERSTEKPAANVLPLAGYWMDGDGNWMELKTTESKVMIRPLSDKLKGRMDKGSAKINADKSLATMITLKDGDVAQTMQMRVVEEGKRIALKDGGRFDFKGTDRSALPSEIQKALKEIEDAKNPKFADLVAEIKSFNYGKGKATVQVVIKNIGDAEAPATKCRVFLTKNKKVNRSKDTKLALKTVPNLAPGESVTMKFGEGVKESKIDGMNIAVVVDYDGQVEEKDEANEFFMKAGKVDKDKKGKSGKSSKKNKKKGKKGKK